MRNVRATRTGLWLILSLTACSDPGVTPEDRLPVYGGVTELFRTPTQPGYRFMLPALDERRIYADLETGGPVVALDRATGKEIWRSERPFGGPISVSIHQGKVLYAGGVAIAIDAASGTEVWRFDPGGSASLGVSTAYAGGFYFGTDRFAFALSVADGSLLWRAELANDWPHRSIVRGTSVGGDTVYVNVEQYLSTTGHLAVGHIFALDRHTGELIWRYTEGDGSDRHWFRNEPTVSGRWILLGDLEANAFLALDRMTGLLRWRTYGDRDRYFGALDVPKVSNDTVYASSADRWVYAMHLETGEILWSTRLGGSVNTIALCGSRVLASDGVLNVLDRATGRLLKTVEEGIERGGIQTSKFVEDGREAYILGDRFVYGYRCPA